MRKKAMKKKPVHFMRKLLLVSKNDQRKSGLVHEAIIKKRVESIYNLVYQNNELSFYLMKHIMTYQIVFNGGASLVLMNHDAEKFKWAIFWFSFVCVLSIFVSILLHVVSNESSIDIVRNINNEKFNYYKSLKAALFNLKWINRGFAFLNSCLLVFSLYALNVATNCFTWP